MGKKESIGSIVGREVMRAMMERVQSIDNNLMMKAFGADEPAVYDDVEETLNVAYVNREEVALAMDVFKPKVPEGTELPVIVDIHGGGLFMGDRRMNRPYCRMLAHRGYLVFSLEYRLAPKAEIFEQLDDVCAGMDHIGRMLVDYDVDFTRIFMVADSAGAYLAEYVTAMHDSAKLQNAIERKPSRMVFAAVGFLSGMFYTNKMLSNQIFGEKRDDKKFLKFMDPEHPEIVNNLPPAFLLTSCGDMVNNYSIRFHSALQKAGRISKLVYLGDEELTHIFAVMKPEHPRSVEATDMMLSWFEEQADKRRESHKMSEEEKRKFKKLEKRISDGSIHEQKVWAALKERIACSDTLLKREAIIDCAKEYTYEQMFAEWNRYAKVFSALNITSKNNSRVALCGAITAEPIFSMFALNMTGAVVSLFSYPDFLPGGRWKDMVEKEKITDIIVTDIMVTPAILEELKEVKERCGIRNVILLHSLMGGASVGPAELIYNEYNYHTLKNRPDTVFMDDLIKQNQDGEIYYDPYDEKQIAFITHTSGTTKGTRKLLPFTNKAINASSDIVPGGIRSFLEEPVEGRPLRVIQLFDMSSIMALSAQVLGELIKGETLVLTYFGFMHPKFIRALDYYNVDVLFITGFMVDKWLERNDLDDIDLSSLKIVGLAGGYISPEKRNQYKEFFRKHGFRYDFVSGYGMSEAGGKPMFTPKGKDSEVLGFGNGEDVYLIKDENDGKFYRADEGVRTGVLYKLSDIRSENKLDGETLFEYTNIDGKDFVCTNDLVRVNEDGSLTFAGRMDKYFVINEGRKFDSGIVDLQMSYCSAINKCAVVPIMEKRIHDTVPVFYVVPAEKDAGAPERIRQAFVDVYVKEKKIPADNLPTQFVIVDEIPLNVNGKLDIYRITRERLQGDAYDLVPVKENGELRDITIVHREQLNSITAGTLPEGMQNNSAYNIFDLFTAPSDGAMKLPELKDLLKPWRLFMPETDEDQSVMPEIPNSVMNVLMKYGVRLSGLFTGRRWIDTDFTDE